MRKIAVLAVAGALAVPAAAMAGDNSGTGPAESCKEQRAAMGVNAFKALYGTNKTKSNAFGKCVSKQARAQETAHETAHDNAPAACRAERKLDPDAFAEKYGTNRNNRNAFGKCVSATAKADAEEAIEDHDDAVVNAAKTCKAERKLDPGAFAEKYGTNRNNRNAFGKCVSATVRAEDS